MGTSNCLDTDTLQNICLCSKDETNLSLELLEVCKWQNIWMNLPLKLKYWCILIRAVNQLKYLIAINRAIAMS